ncbi:MAG: hypothetical protein K2H49_04390, partial [Muribaculaceae bacterium]|nr:hypothetical protein [Muribaculaceae bacterium]
MKIRILLLLILLAIPAFRPLNASALERKRLVIINSYHDGAPWSQDIINPVLYDISKRDDFFAPEVIHLSNTLIHNAEDFSVMEDGLFQRFRDRKPDYLVLVGNFSFTLRDRIVKEWGDVPILLICQSEDYGTQQFYYTDVSGEVACEDLKPLKELQGKYNFSIVHIPNMYKQTIDLMAHMFPDMSRLVFIADALYINRHLNHEIKDFLADNYPDIEYEWLVAGDDTGARLQHYLNSRDFNIGVLLSTWFYERMTIHGYPQLISGDAQLIKSVRHPVFGLRYAYFSYGITGGVFPSPTEFEEDLKAGLDDLISGKNMRKVPFRTVNTDMPIINYEKLERCGIPQSVCPKDTVYINKPKTLWEQYYIAMISIGIAAFAFVVVGVVMLFYQRRRIDLLADRARLIGNMPIGYSQATLLRGSDGKVAEIKYQSYNDTFRDLLKRNELPDYPSGLFKEEEMEGIAQRLVEERKTLRFSHHFDETDTDYEFLATITKDLGKSGYVVDIFAIDITDQKKKEQMLIEAREKARESDKLKMAFLANMSHEIRTPLNAIVGFSRLLPKTKDPAKQARFVETIDVNNELLLKLIGDILDTAKIESNTLDVHMESTDVNSLLLSVDSTVRFRLKEGVTLSLE